MRTLRSIMLFVIPAAALVACGSEKATQPPLPIHADSLAPKIGTVGTQLEIYGTGFATSGAKVYVGTAASTNVQAQGGELFAAAPAGLTVGTTYDVKIVNPDGGSVTLPAAFKAVAPTVTRVNGATMPTGLVGMTVLIEGSAFGDFHDGKVVFTSGGTAYPAVIADTVNDWTDNYIVTTVPQGVGSTSQITVQTATGTTVPVTFTLISGATFSPSAISWTKTDSLPEPLQGLAAVFVAPATKAAAGNNVYVVGGALDSTNVATSVVYSAQAQQSGGVGAWSTLTPLPAARAYHSLVAATAFNAAIDTLTSQGYLYAIGGMDSTGRTVNTVYASKIALDGTLGAWQTATPLPAAVHSAGAVIFRGYLYVAGGADSTNTPKSTMYRAAIASDGTLGTWESLPALPQRTSSYSLLNFGPYIYAVGGDSGVVPPVQGTTSGNELSGASLARIDLRTGKLTSAGWTATSAMSKARSKHSTLAAGGYLFATSGVYAGQAGSSENTYSQINSDGTISSFAGATGVNTIGSLLGYDLYNQAAVSFVDATGKGHVLVLGGAKREAPGRATAQVVYY